MGKVFGAYTDISWTSNIEWKNGNGNTFIFSLRDDFNFVKLKCLNNKYEIFNCGGYLTAIGSGANVFYIIHDCNINTTSYSNFGEIEQFELPQGI